MNEKDQDLLKIVAQRLGEDLLDEVVFVGGVTTSIYIENDESPNTTPTEDVDLIVNVTSYLGYEEFEKRIGERGFKRKLAESGPICRFFLGDIVVDFMPLNERILGFSNRWYSIGFSEAMKISLDGLTIRILSFANFLATKIEAYSSRGKKGMLWESKDFEDIVVVLEGRKSLLEDLEALPDEVKVFSKIFFNTLLLDHEVLREAIAACLKDYGTSIASQRALLLMEKLKKFVG
jgi:hypothetical protein